MSDDWKLPPEQLEAWPADAPPDGFADRVMVARAVDRERAALAARSGLDLPAPLPARRPQRWALAGLVGAGLAAAVLLLLAMRNPSREPSRLAGGIEDLGERRSLDVGGRATAVAEPGARVSWRVGADGRARVEQQRGNVFYRVEKGGAFVVQTPAGDVTVLGTCFRVEVDPMNPKMQSVVAAGAGAVVTAAVLVTVYEGKVRVSNAHGQVDVRAGEQAAASAAGAPERTLAPDGLVKVAMAGPPAELMAPPAEGATREQLLARDARQREHIAMLDGRVRKLEAAIEAGPRVRKGAPGEREKVYGMSPEEWATMAESCEVRFHLPPFDVEPRQINEKMAEEAGLSAEERVSINEMFKRENDRFLATLRVLYVEATGDTSGVETLEPGAMGMEIQHKSTERDSAAARRRIALEHAGKLAPPADLSRMPVIDRYFRLVTGAGDQFQVELGKIVGPERAAEMRENFSGNRSIISGCDDEGDEAEVGQ